MNESTDAQTLTSTLLSTIRLQRHLGARVIICTQEPTISPALLDLCSVTIVHRFTSPEWMQSLRAHLAAVAPDVSEQLSGASEDGGDTRKLRIPEGKNHAASVIFNEIVDLRVGEALLFSPSGMVETHMASENRSNYASLGTKRLKIRVRARLTTDGRKSVLAA